MNYNFKVQERKRIRVIIDTDVSCEADDQYAIVHALLTPKLIAKGIVAEQYNNAKGGNSVHKSYAEALKILQMLNRSDIPVYYGTSEVLSDEENIPDSRGADFIIEEALKNSEYPLFVFCIGALSNMATAIKKCPEIESRLTCIWIGGGQYPDCGRYEIRDGFCFDKNGIYAKALDNRKVRVYTDLDTRYILEDFFSKLSLNFEIQFIYYEECFARACRLAETHAIYISQNTNIGSYAVAI